MKIESQKARQTLFTPKKLQSIKEITKIKLEEKKGGFFSRFIRNIKKKLFKKSS